MYLHCVIYLTRTKYSVAYQYKLLYLHDEDIKNATKMALI